MSIHGIEKHYGDFTAVFPTTLVLEPGKTTCLIGPSGCGKSTLLRLMMGLIPPTSGYVEFQGERLTPNNRLRIRRSLGYVIQDGGLFPHLTAAKNITLMARFLRRPQSEYEQRMIALAEMAHLPLACLQKYPKQLSGGQKQRVSLIRALMLDPQVLLMDEPMGALDPMIRSELQRDLREVFQTLHKTVVLVTHDLNEAYYLADDIVLFRRGKVIQRGSFEDLIHNPVDQFVTDFVLAQRSVLPSKEDKQ